MSTSRRLGHARAARAVLAGVIAAVLVAACAGPSSVSSVSSGSSGSPVSSVSPVPTRPTATGAKISKVLTIVEENHSLAQMRAEMPFLSAVATEYGYATGYTALTHPSLPNYLALSGGSTFGITDDKDPDD